MAQKVLFVVYDNGSYDNIFPMGFGAIGGVLKQDGHEISVWSQDIHHWPDEDLKKYLDENKFDVVILSVIAGYWQYQKMRSLSKAINNSKNRSRLKYIADRPRIVVYPQIAILLNFRLYCFLTLLTSASIHKQDHLCR